MNIFNRVAAKLNEKIFDKIADRMTSEAKREFNEAAQSAVVGITITSFTIGTLIGWAVLMPMIGVPLGFIAVAGGMAGGFGGGLLASKKFLNFMKKRAMR